MNRIKIGPLDLYGCREALERLDDYIDREIRPDEAKKVATHLKICRVCATKFRFEELFLSEVRAKMNAIELPDEIEQRVFEALEKEKNKP